MKPRVAVALSGGVDSLTTAWLLKEQGYQVIAVHFVTGYEGDTADSLDQSPISIDSLLKAAYAKLAPMISRLDIPLRILDVSDRFKTEVVDYFIDSYRSGRTPSPCLVCNPAIKFGDLFSFMRRLGAERLATGHYARTGRGRDGQIRLYRGIDATKDQSYFLARLSRHQLERALFPLGEMTKADVIALAQRKNLTPVTAGESQDICFINGGAYGEFMARQAGFKTEPGPIVTTDGKEVGEHPGLHLFTVGQRRGINCPATNPYYVVRIEAEKNRLVVGGHESLFSDTCRVEEINWICPVPERPIRVAVKVRYRHDAVAATIDPVGHHAAQVRFDQPQAAVTPGQGAVFYQKDEVLGGGWIIGQIPPPVENE